MIHKNQQTKCSTEEPSTEKPVGYIIENATVCTPLEKLVNSSGKITRVVIKGERIEFVGLEEKDNEEIRRKYKEYERIDANGKIVTPGLIDTHVHLNFPNNYPYTRGNQITFDDYFNGIRTIESGFLKNGVTAYMLATMAMPDQKLEEMLDAIYSKSKCKDGSRLLGTVIEGTFINKGMCGAMDPDLIQERDGKYFAGLINNFKDLLKKVVIAPEVGPYMELIDYVRKRQRDNIILSLGHSNAPDNIAIESFEKGIRILNHFYNRQSPFNHRNLGIVGAVFKENGNFGLYPELVADYIHVCKEAVNFLVEQIEIRGRDWKDAIILVTDAINVLGDFNIDPQGYKIKKHNSRDIYYLLNEDKKEAPYLDPNRITLYGSCLTMPEAVRNMVSLKYLEKWNADPLLSAISSATLTPAVAHYIDKERGSLEKGKYADVTIFNRDYGAGGETLGNCERVFVEGRRVR